MKKEMAKQEYKNMKISSGITDEGILKDSIYLKMEDYTDKGRDIELQLTPDEAQAITYCLNGALWAFLINVLGRRNMEVVSKEWRKSLKESV